MAQYLLNTAIKSSNKEQQSLPHLPEQKGYSMIKFDTLTSGVQTQQQRQSSQTAATGFAELLAEQTTQTKTATTAPTQEQQPPEAIEATEKPNLREELMRLASMSPAELIRHQMLNDMGLTEESLKALPYEERMKIEALIKEEIERQLGVEGEDV